MCSSQRCFGGSDLVRFCHTFADDLAFHRCYLHDIHFLQVDAVLTMAEPKSFV